MLLLTSICDYYLFFILCIYFSFIEHETGTAKALKCHCQKSYFPTCASIPLLATYIYCVLITYRFKHF